MENISLKGFIFQNLSQIYQIKKKKKTTKCDSGILETNNTETLHIINIKKQVHNAADLNLEM